MMKKILILLLFPAYLQAQEIPKNADSLLVAYHKQDLFTGNVLIAKGGKAIFKKSYGLANIADNKPNDENTTFRIGSISKCFTAIVILKLQEQSLLNIEDPLSKYYPEFKNGDSIKIKHLLSNTSGIRDFIGFVSAAKWPGLKSYKTFIDAITTEPSRFSPGTKFEYSSSNFLILCAIAEEVSHKNYNSLLQEYVIKKAGMKHTGMDYIGRKDHNKATGYKASRTNFYEQVPEINIALFAGAGGMYSCVADLLAFDRALYGKELLSERSKEIMFSPNKGNYAYGWEVLNQDSLYSIGHSGSIDGFKANFIRYPNERTTLIILSNYQDIQSYELYKALGYISTSKAFEMPSSHQFIKLKNTELEQYAGEYAMNEKMALTIKIEGNLLNLVIPGGDEMTLYAESANDFYIRSNNAYCRFIRNENNKVISVQLVKGKRISNWKKRS